MTTRDSAALLLSFGLALAPLRVEAATAPAASASTTTPATGSAATTATTATVVNDEKAANLKRAEELFRNGERLYTEGSYESAILAFQECYELSREPQLLYNIGNAYERLGDFANSRRYLDQYRAFAPEKEREALSRRIQALDQRQREKEQKEREAAATTTPDPGTSVVTQPRSEAQPPPPADAPPPKKDRIYGPAAMVLTAGVVLGLGLGIGFGVTAAQQKKDALDGCSDAGGTLYCSAISSDFLNKRKLNALVADIGFAVAGAAAIGLITVIAVKASRHKKASNRAALAPYASPRGAGLALHFKF